MKKFTTILFLVLTVMVFPCFSEGNVSNTEPFRVHTGYYIVGEEFEAGSYDIRVICENEDDKSTGYIFVWKDSDSFFVHSADNSISIRVTEGNIEHINLHDGNVLVSDSTIPVKLEFTKTR